MLPTDRIERVEGWGMAVGAAGFVYRPSGTDGIRQALDTAANHDVSVTPRGAGCSYGDAAFRPESVVLDLDRMRRILEWDPTTGQIDVEPGVSVRQLWRYALGDGWWPAVVTGTMEPTAGGSLGMNVHGKNNWKRGTFGDNCVEFDLMTADGKIRTVTRDADQDLFHAVIGSFGQLGVITRARLQLKKISSGLLDVKGVAAPNLGAMLEAVDQAKDDWEYVVGWIDAFRGGRGLGGGLLHYARHLEEGEDPAPAQSLRCACQDLPDTMFGVLPKALMWRLLKPFTNRPGMRLVNRAKYVVGSTIGNDASYRQSLAGFSFLLDYVPDWKFIYRPGGLIQHQSFVPVAQAEEVFRRQLELCRRRGFPSFLAVLKRHRPDDFLLSHAVDGFSLALDFPVVRRRRERLWALVRELAEMVVEAGGRFYPAKDAAIPAALYRASFPDGQLDRFADLKAEIDPEGRFCSALADRLLG